MSVSPVHGRNYRKFSLCVYIHTHICTYIHSRNNSIKNTWYVKRVNFIYSVTKSDISVSTRVGVSKNLIKLVEFFFCTDNRQWEIKKVGGISIRR